MEQSLIFGDVISSDYGIYISGEGVFNAPRRDAEMISIPGRNGTYLLDHNRFDNIVVTYPAHCVADNMDEFRSKLRDYRNALSAKRGYQRLHDTINGDEYRMASFIDGFESEPIGLSLASTFELKFNCKPQRFLLSGEIETPVQSGGVITNPTLFESHPLILVDGYGEFDINGESITIQQGAVMGETILKNATTTNDFRVTVDLDSNNYLEGDIITVDSGVSFSKTYKLNRSQIEAYHRIKSVECTLVSSGYEPILELNDSNTNVVLGLKKTGATNFTAGTDSTNGSKTARFSAAIYDAVSGTDIGTVVLQIFFDYLDYSASAERITIGGSGSLEPNYFNAGNEAIYQPQISVNSSVSVLGQLYIDLDIGECYRIENGQIISINTATILPADLPTLKPGDNIITYDNTFTSFKVTPRYWRV